MPRRYLRSATYFTLQEGIVESTRFDRLTRTWSSHAPRRTVLGALFGGAFGLTALTEGEAKKKGKKVTLCLNGQTLNVKKSKKGSLLSQGATQGACASSPPPPPPRPSPPPPVNRCANGVKDGTESDVDCGGSCGRCEVPKACNSRDDCITARCVNFACDVCTNAGQCGSDDFGLCACTDGSCTSNAWKPMNGADCNDCPERSNACIPFADGNFDGVLCLAPCGEGFTDDE
jgi:hypothetical protein